MKEVSREWQCREAALPGTGNESIAFTYSFDVSRFVSALLSRSKWEETTYCYEEMTTWNEFIKVAESEVSEYKAHDCPWYLAAGTRPKVRLGTL